MNETQPRTPNAWRKKGMPLPDARPHAIVTNFRTGAWRFPNRAAPARKAAELDRAILH
jgi:hypothetical protein